MRSAPRQYGVGWLRVTQMSSRTIIVPKGSAASDVYLQLPLSRLPRVFPADRPIEPADGDGAWIQGFGWIGYAIATKFRGNAMPHVIIGKINAVIT